MNTNSHNQGHYQVLSALEFAMMEWHKRLKAAQSLRRFYKDSIFAIDTIAIKEKEFKKKWWDACQEYSKFKKEYLGE